MFFYFRSMQIHPSPYTPSTLFSIRHAHDFEELALLAFRHQYHHNQVYHIFCNYMGVHEEEVQTVADIPFLPIELFKTHRIITGEGQEEKIFRSSGTTGSVQSCHYLLDEEIYRLSLTEGFTRVFGKAEQYSFLALLPGYVERPDSSLIYMVNELMKQSRQQNNSFFKEADQELIKMIRYNQQHDVRTILFGVSFSLLQFAEKNPISLEKIILIETGGMKGKMEEKTRNELHTILREKFHIDRVYSEYGMTELLSQAYCSHGEEFELPPWMQILIREVNDPKTFMEEQRTGGINVIDLANIYSCCFISTQDLGKKTSPNTFEVLGRFDNADIRGCNLLFA